MASSTRLPLPFRGNIIHNASGSAPTVTASSQPSITTLDNVTLLNGTTVGLNTLSGLTSVTSAEFIGNLVGNASGTAATVTAASQPSITTLNNVTSIGNIFKIDSSKVSIGNMTPVDGSSLHVGGIVTAYQGNARLLRVTGTLNSDMNGCKLTGLDLTGFTFNKSTYLGNIINIIGVECNAHTVSGTGTATYAMGLYIKNAFNSSIAVNRYAIFSGSTDPSYISGSVGIGTTLPTSKLTVVDSINTISSSYIGLLRFVSDNGMNYIQSGLVNSSGSAAPLSFGSYLGAVEWARLTSANLELKQNGNSLTLNGSTHSYMNFKIGGVEAGIIGFDSDYFSKRLTIKSSADPASMIQYESSLHEFRSNDNKYLTIHPSGITFFGTVTFYRGAVIDGGVTIIGGVTYGSEGTFNTALNLISTVNGGRLRIASDNNVNYIQSAINSNSGSAAPLSFGSYLGAVEWARMSETGLELKQNGSALKLFGTNHSYISFNPTGSSESGAIGFTTIGATRSLDIRSNADSFFSKVRFHTPEVEFWTSGTQFAAMTRSYLTLIGSTSNYINFMINGVNAGSLGFSNGSYPKTLYIVANVDSLSKVLFLTPNVEFWDGNSKYASISPSGATFTNITGTISTASQPNITTLGGVTSIRGMTVGANDITVNTINVNNINSSSLAFTNGLLPLATSNTADINDIGFYGKYISGGTTYYTGLFRDASVGGYYLFNGQTSAPTTIFEGARTAASFTCGNISFNTVTSGIWQGSSISTNYTDAKIKSITSTDITVGNTNGDITLALPQSIGTTSSPIYEGLTIKKGNDSSHIYIRAGSINTEAYASIFLTDIATDYGFSIKRYAFDNTLHIFTQNGYNQQHTSVVNIDQFGNMASVGTITAPILSATVYGTIGPTIYDQARLTVDGGYGGTPKCGIKIRGTYASAYTDGWSRPLEITNISVVTNGFANQKLAMIHLSPNTCSSSSQLTTVYGLYIDSSFGGSDMAATRYAIYTAGFNHVYFGGNVGIGGITNPTFQLQINDDSAGKPFTTTWQISSDRRIKINIIDADLDECLNTINALQVKEFDFHPIYAKQCHSKLSVPKWGLIADDVQEIAPFCVDIIPGDSVHTDPETGETLTVVDQKTLNIDELLYASFGSIKKLANLYNAQKVIIDSQQVTINEQQIQASADRNRITELESQLVSVLQRISDLEARP